MNDMYKAFATGKLTAKDDLIRALADVVYSKQPDTEKVTVSQGLLNAAFEGARDRARGFDVEVE